MIILPTTTAETVAKFFQSILQRAPSASTSAFFVDRIDTGQSSLTDVKTAIINLSETTNFVDPVIRLYQAAFGRVPDQAGLSVNVNAVRSGIVEGQGGITFSQLAEAFAVSAEYITRFGGNVVTRPFLDAVYSQVLGRAPDAVGLATFLNGSFTPGQVLTIFSNSVEFINNSNSAIDRFLNEAADGTQDFSGSLFDNASSGTQLTTAVDDLTGTSGNDAFIGTFDGTAASTSNTGDKIEGGAGIDTVSITSTGGNGDAAGIVPIPALTNVEKLIVTEIGQHEDINVSGFFGLTSLELIGGTTGTNGNLDITLDAGQTLTLDRILDGNDTVTANGDIDIRSASSVTSQSVIVQGVGVANTTTTQGDIELDINGTGVATLNVTSEGTATNFINIENTGGALATVNITGATALVSTGIANNVTTINASATTGGVNITVNDNNTTNNSAVAITGGSGADRFAFFDGELTVADSLNGGTGTDTIAINDSFNPAAVIAGVNAATSFEILEYTASNTVTINASAFNNINSFTTTSVITTAPSGPGAPGFPSNPGTAGVIFTANANDTLTIGASVTGGDAGAGNTAVLGGAGLLIAPIANSGNDAANIVLGGGVTITGGAGAVGGGPGAGVNASTIESLNITSNGTSANSIVSTSTGNNDVVIATGGSVNVSGTQNIDLGIVGTGVAGGTKVTINASALSGNLTVTTGSADGDIISGGSGADIIDSGSGSDFVSGGGGADTFLFDLSNNNVTGGVPSSTVFERITDFNTGGNDKIDFGSLSLTTESAAIAAPLPTVSASINSEGFATFTGGAGLSETDLFAAQLIALEQTINIGFNGNATGEFALFEFTGSTLLFVSDGSSGLTSADGLIQLFGVTGLSNTTISSGDLFIT